MGAVLVEILLVMLLSAHLVLINIGGAGPLVCAWLERKELRHYNVVAGYIARQLAPLSMVLLTAAGFFGLAQLWVMQWTGETEYLEGIRRLPSSKYWWGLAQLMFSLVLVAAYMDGWKRLKKHPNWHQAIAVLAGVNLLYHFVPMMVIMSIIGTRQDLASGPMDNATYRALLIDGEVLSRTIHIWLASVAVTAMLVMMYTMRIQRVDDPSFVAEARQVSVWAARLALAPTLIQMLIGIWVLAKMPDDAKYAVMGGEWAASGLMAVSLAAALVLRHVLAAVSLGDTSRKALKRCILMMAVVVVLMTATLRQTRFAATIEVENVQEFDGAGRQD